MRSKTRFSLPEEAGGNILLLGDLGEGLMSYGFVNVQILF